METSAPVKVLIIIAAGFIVSGFAVSWWVLGKTGQLLAWIAATIWT